jgi:hypothetical protein
LNNLHHANSSVDYLGIDKLLKKSQLTNLMKIYD